MKTQVSPLSTSFFVASIIGFFISVFWIPRYSVPYSAAFAVVFAIMFASSMRSMHYAGTDEPLKARPKK